MDIASFKLKAWYSDVPRYHRPTEPPTIYTRFNVPHRFIVPRPPEPEHVPPTFVPPTLPNFNLLI